MVKSKCDNEQLNDNERYTIQPLIDPNNESLTCFSCDEIKKVTLTEIHVDSHNQNNSSITIQGSDILHTFHAYKRLFAFEKGDFFCHATFNVLTTDGQEHTLTIKLPDAISYDGDLGIIHRWLAKRGFVVGKSHESKNNKSGSLETFWHIFDHRLDCTATQNEWKQSLGDAFQHLRRQYLLSLDKFAKFYPNPSDPNGKPFNVVAKRDGTFIAVSNNRKHRISLKPKDIQFSRWNIHLFRNHIAQTLGIEPSSDMVNADDRLIRLGYYRPSPDEKHPVYWLRAINEVNFQCELSCLLLRHKSPFFLMTGTRIDWERDLEVQNGLIERHSPLFALSEVLEFRDGKFVTTEVWHKAFEPFRKHTLKSATDLVNVSRAFKRRAKSFDVTFERIDDNMGTNPNELSVMEQVRRMETVVAQTGTKLGDYASPEEYESVLNRTLREYGITSMRAIVEMEY